MQSQRCNVWYCAMTETETHKRKPEELKLRTGGNHGNGLGNNAFTSENNPARDWEHPRRCQAFLKKHGRQCRKWAVAGNKYCDFHCPAQRKRIAMGNKVDNMRPRDVTRLRFYEKRLGPRLKDFVEQCLSSPESEQLNLFEELAIMRDMAGEALQLRTAAEMLVEKANTPANQLALANANAIVADSLKTVREFSRAASDIYNAQEDKFSVHALHDVVQQLKRIVYACFEHDPIALDRFEMMIEERLSLPSTGASGTTLTPDADVIAMDNCIPRAPLPNGCDLAVDDAAPDEPQE